MVDKEIVFGNKILLFSYECFGSYNFCLFGLLGNLIIFLFDILYRELFIFIDIKIIFYRYKRVMESGILIKFDIVVWWMNVFWEFNILVIIEFFRLLIIVFCKYIFFCGDSYILSLIMLIFLF